MQEIIAIGAINLLILLILIIGKFNIIARIIKIKYG
jgi:hypothetical protein